MTIFMHRIAFRNLSFRPAAQELASPSRERLIRHAARQVFDPAFYPELFWFGAILGSIQTFREWTFGPEGSGT